MGNMYCGCGLLAGGPILVADLERHQEHTMECLLYWELIVGADSDPALRDKVSTARLAIGEFVTKQRERVHPVAAALGIG